MLLIVRTGARRTYHIRLTIIDLLSSAAHQNHLIAIATEAIASVRVQERHRSS
ncbi:hypothetical protein [Nostoc sp.]|uniref:hypothetical protein n=1 Tax=Nostoc sp. TaxID=1180 RepID=UPI002FF8CA06